MVVEGPGPAPGIWVTMETGPRGDNKQGMEFQRSRSQAAEAEEWESSGKFFVVVVVALHPRGLGEVQEGWAVFRIKDPYPAPQQCHLEPVSGFSILHHPAIHVAEEKPAFIE